MTKRQSYKADINQGQAESHVGITKALNEELMQVTYVVMKPGVDLHGDYVSIETIRKGKESFNKSLMRANMYHTVMTDAFEIIESYTAPADMVLNGNAVQKGEWLATLQINKGYEEVWDMIKNDELTGISIGASALVEEFKDTEVTPDTDD